MVNSIVNSIVHSVVLQLCFSSSSAVQYGRAFLSSPMLAECVRLTTGLFYHIPGKPSCRLSIGSNFHTFTLSRFCTLYSSTFFNCNQFIYCGHCNHCDHCNHFDHCGHSDNYDNCDNCTIPITHILKLRTHDCSLPQGHRNNPLANVCYANISRLTTVALAWAVGMINMSLILT
jgi:hypothetical protein